MTGRRLFSEELTREGRSGPVVFLAQWVCVIVSDWAMAEKSDVRVASSGANQRNWSASRLMDAVICF